LEGARKILGTANKATAKKEIGHKESPKNGALKFGDAGGN
jgi:hypothetical protein